MSDSGIRPDDQRRRPSGVRAGVPVDAIQASAPKLQPSPQLARGYNRPLKRLLLAASVVGLIVAIVYGLVLAWPRPAREPVAMLQGQGCIKTMAFSPDGSLLACGGSEGPGDYSGRLVVWDVGTRERRLSVALEQWGNCVAFSPDGKSLAVACGRSRQSTDNDPTYH